MGIGELRDFDVAIAFLHSQGEINATEGGIDDTRSKELNKDMKSV
jgi:hypothetical protein